MSKVMYHWHHIIPRHAGGTDEPSNLIRLTVEEHAEAHRLLWEQHGRVQDKLAWLMLSGKTSESETLFLEIYRENGKKSKGRKHTEETKEKIRQKNKKMIFTEEHKRKISESKTGKLASEETKQKLSISHKGIPCSEAAKIASRKIWLGKKIPKEIIEKRIKTRKENKLKKLLETPVVHNF